MAKILIDPQQLEQILASCAVNGGALWARGDGNIHTPAGYSSIDVGNFLGDVGLTVSDEPKLADMALMYMRYQNKNGSFKYAKSNSQLPCISARILAALGKIKAADIVDVVAIEKAYLWLIEQQCEDGGWRCKTVKLGMSAATDASNPGTTLYVLDAFRFRENSEQVTEKLYKAIEFLLSHWQTRLPLGPCNFGIGTRFLTTEFPFLRYNLFYYVYVLSQYKHCHNDKRFMAAKAQLTEYITVDGVMINHPHKAWQNYSFAQKAKSSRLAKLVFEA